MSWKSSLLAFGRDERVVLMAIGLATFGIVSTVVATLTMIRDDNELPHEEPKTQYITQDTEDSLQLDTLEKLLGHPNYSIREIALKILSDRAMNDEQTVQQLLVGVTRPQYDERMLSLRALALLLSQTAGQDGLFKLHNKRAYAALVRSLELSLDDAPRPKLDNKHWDEYYLRDMAERFCLTFALELSSTYGATMLVRAKFVEKWLVKQDWGDTEEERCENFRDYMDTKSNRVVDIVNHIRRSRRGFHALVNSGLLNKRQSRRMQELPSLDATGIVFMDSAGLRDTQSRPVREQSAEEQRRRRQHREAMVLNDGTRPPRWEDIFQQEHDSLVD